MSVILGSTGVTFPDSTTQTTAATSGAINVQTFTSSGTWTKPSGYAAGSRAFIQCWGAGASGGKSGVSTALGGGGGGGGYNERWITLSSMGATETITIGAGGAAKATNGTGLVGGTTSVGSLVYAYGGGGGGYDYTTALDLAYGGGGGGGGQLSAGSSGDTGTVTSGLPGKPSFAGNGGLYYQSTGAGEAGSASYINGGGGGSMTAAPTANLTTGGASVWGGGGGGGGNTSAFAGVAGGASSYAGAGGASGNTTAVSGTAPSGGGGGSGTGNSGAGGAGQVIITVFPA